MDVFSGRTFNSFKSAMNLSYRMLSSIVSLSLFGSLFAVLWLAWYHGSGPVLVYRFWSSSTCLVILLIIMLYIINCTSTSSTIFFFQGKEQNKQTYLTIDLLSVI